MGTARRRRVWIAPAVLALLGAMPLSVASLSAQTPAVRAHLQPAEVEVWQQFQLIVEVSGVKEVEDVFVPPVFHFPSHRHDGLLPFSTEITTPEPGQPGGVVEFSYTFLATGAGSIDVGPVLVTVDGRVFETERVTLLVKDPESVTVRARVEPAEVRMMEEFDLYVEVTGVESLLEKPILPDISDFARRSGSSGRDRASAEFGFVASKRGTHEIGPVSVKVGSKTYESEPLTLVVHDEPPVVEVFAALNTGETWVGSDFVLHVMAEGGPEFDEAPVLPDMSDFAELLRDPHGGGFGGMAGGSAAQYRFRALTTGEFEVGPVAVTAGGQTVQTEPIHLMIGEEPAEPAVSPEDLLPTTEADARRVHVGEPVIVSYGLLSRQSPWSGSETWRVQYDTLTMPKRKDLRIQQLPGNHVWEEQRVSVDGRWYQPSRVARLAVLPREPGRITIGPAKLKLQIHRRNERRSLSAPPDFLANPAESHAKFAGIWTPMTLTTDPVSIEVVRLPRDGRPESFSGHVGRLELVSWVDRTDAGVGDTVTLHFELAGDGHSRIMPDLEIALPDGFDVVGPGIDHSNPLERDGSLRGARYYTYRLVAKRPGSFHIPVVEVSWFDPESESYGFSRAGPFDFIIVPGEKE